jgi:hypothetical protein
MDKVMELARGEGANRVELVGKWQGYDVYNYIDDTADPNAVMRQPWTILAKDNEVRFTTSREAYECWGYLIELNSQAKSA